MKYYLISLGCPKNLVDSERFSAIIEAGGYELTTDPVEADTIIINTCGFIQDAKVEAVDTILEAAEYKKDGANLIVTGCLVRRYFEDIQKSIPEIDHLVDLQDFDKFAQIFTIPTVSKKRKLMTAGHYAYLRITDGCNNLCSYCAIPSIRGSLCSKPIEELLQEAEELAAGGVKELIIIGQDIAQYGVDLYGEQKLAKLLKQIHKIEALKWIKLLYLHPAHITTELLDTISTLPKICRYFDIPIQHINDDILHSMNRHISKAETIALLDDIRSKFPEAVIRTTIITGYPGETKEHFEELKEFIIEQKFERLGVFVYSPEEDTTAYGLKKRVPSKLALARKDELMSIQQQISIAFLENFIGSYLPVIIDAESDSDDFHYIGRTYFDAPEIDGIVYLTGNDLGPGDIVKTNITDSTEYDLIGEYKQTEEIQCRQK
jgi:ribosomal protein S12 methylthiotransferase